MPRLVAANRNRATRPLRCRGVHRHLPTLCYVPRFPLVDPALFPETVSLAYYQPNPQHLYGIASRKASVFTFLTFCTINNLEIRPGAAANGDNYAVEAHTLLPEVMLELPTLGGLQSRLMLVSPPIPQVIPHLWVIILLQQKRLTSKIFSHFTKSSPAIVER